MTDIRDQVNEVPLSISEMAAMWFQILHSGHISRSEREAYLLWLKVSPVHIAELLRVCRMYSFLKSMKPLEFAASAEDVVVDFHSLQPRRSQHTTSPKHRFRKRLASCMRSLPAIAAMISVGIGTLTVFWAVLHEASWPAPDHLRAVPFLGTAVSVLISVLAATAGALIGLDSVRRDRPE